MQFHHIGLFTAHPFKIIDFYKKIFGFKEESRISIPPEVAKPLFGIRGSFQMAKLRRDKVCVEIFWHPSRRARGSRRTIVLSGFNHLGIEVEDKQRFCARLHKKFQTKIIKVDRGTYYTYFIPDPDGNLIEVIDDKWKRVRG